MRLRTFFSVLAILFVASFAQGAEVSLTADSMRYDSKKGLFYGEGHVKLSREGLSLVAQLAEGDMDGKRVRFIGDVRAEGKWNEDVVELSCGEVATGFGDVRSYRFAGGVRGRLGKRMIDADSVVLSGDAFSIEKVRSFVDDELRVFLSAAAIDGHIVKGEVSDVTARGGVVLKSGPKKDLPTTIRGSRAVYSKARGSIVVSGAVTAVQGDRTLRAESLVYFLASGRIEAAGKPQIVFPLKGSSAP